MSDDQEAELRRKAARRVDAKLAFRSHLMVYAIVNAGLFTINLLTSPGEWWFVWPAAGWGVGLLAHGLSTYAFVGDRDRMIEEELKRLRGPGG